MSRALYLNRPFPTTKDLAATALGIISSGEHHNPILANELNHIAEAYIDLCQNFEQAKDFYGLRDFYQLVKYLDRNMTSRDSIDLHLLSRAVCRNFGGSEEFRKNNLNLFAGVLVFGTINNNILTSFIQQNWEEKQAVLILKNGLYQRSNSFETTSRRNERNPTMLAT